VLEIINMEMNSVLRKPEKKVKLPGFAAYPNLEACGSMGTFFLLPIN